MRAPAVALALSLAACGAVDAPPDVDGALVEALADLHLADARAALDSTAAPGLDDSLRAVALEAHGLSEAGLDAHLEALAADPELAQATYDSLDVVLTRERQAGYLDAEGLIQR